MVEDTKKKTVYLIAIQRFRSQVQTGAKQDCPQDFLLSVEVR